jgi:CDP-glucose 4,6-dehydratase
MRVEDIVKRAIAILGKWEYKIQKDETLHEAGLLLLDNSKSKNLLGWKPKFGVDEAITRTLEWYQEYADGKDMKKISREQIERFIS